VNSSNENLLIVDSSVQLQWKNFNLNFCNLKLNLTGEESDLHSGKNKIWNRGQAKILYKQDFLDARKCIKSIMRSLFTSGVNLLLTGNNLRVTGNNLRDRGNDLPVRGNHLTFNGGNLWADGNNLQNSGRILLAIGNDLWYVLNNLRIKGNNLRHNENEFWITGNHLSGKNHDLQIEVRLKVNEMTDKRKMKQEENRERLFTKRNDQKQKY
jgi:hypothetical protein